jgi:dTMP kinase
MIIPARRTNRNIHPDERQNEGVRMVIIAFSGTDGSGKSTQISMLAERLKTQGHRTRTVWFRPGYSPDAEALKRTWRRLRSGHVPAPGHSEERSRLFAKPGVRRAWLAMALVDTWVQCALKLRLWRLAGYTVLCDRYLDDAAMDLQTEFPELNVDTWVPWRLVCSLCPTPDLQLLLLLPSEEAQRRCDLKNEPFPPSLETRRFREAIYEGWSRDPDRVVVDASQDMEEVHQEIVGVVAMHTNMGSDAAVSEVEP